MESSVINFVGKGLMLAASVLASAGCRDAVPPGNVVALITIDTWRFDHFSSEHTPNLWRLAAEGERFDNAWSPIGLTSPSHATMLTGKLPWVHGMEANNHHGYDLAESVQLWPETAPTGTQTGAFVSAYPAGPEGGLSQGFSTFDGPPTGERSGDITIARAMKWLEQQTNAYLWVHLYEPHGPYVGSGADDVTRYREEVLRADALLEPLLERLVARGARIVVASDHGEVLLEETCGRQHERSTSPHVLHVPLFRWQPSGVAAVREDRVGLEMVPDLLAGQSWGQADLVARTVTLAESGMCETGCAPGCRPEGIQGRDRVAIDDGGRWVKRPGRGVYSEGSPDDATRAALLTIPPVVSPDRAPVSDELKILGYTEP